MTKAGKVWGETRLVTRNPALELHEIAFKAGHKCSEHNHLSKFNGFLVLEGVLLLRVWQESGLVDPATFISHRVDFSEAAACFPEWLNPATGVIKAMISF
jgi:quercetin dioxygenase-like cupin family protein